MAPIDHLSSNDRSPLQNFDILIIQLMKFLLIGSLLFYSFPLLVFEKASSYPNAIKTQVYSNLYQKSCSSKINQTNHKENSSHNQHNKFVDEVKII